MIDLHTHLLPDFPGDDGARSLDEALALCRLAVEDGTAVAVATPHSGGREGLPRGARPTPAGVRAAVATLQAALDGEGIALLMLPGMEHYVEPELANLADGPHGTAKPHESASRSGPPSSDQPATPTGLLTIGASRAVLLEMPAMSFPDWMPDLCFRLQVAGFQPVIAHPERNLGVIQHPELLYGLVSRGAFAQVTAMSLAGQVGREVQRVAELLLEHHLVHVIASDAHWIPERPTGLTAAVEAAARIAGQDHAVAMVTTAPQAILDGRAVTGFSPRVPTPKQRWWPFSGR